MKKQLKNLIIPVLLGLFIWGCYPGGPEYYEDMDIVYTSYDVEYNFQEGRTYARPDQIVKDVKIDNGDTTLIYMKDVYAIPILEAIDRNMAAYGWSKVGINQSPDILLSPAAISTTTFFYSYWYDWWWGGYYPGWGWYYPPYYTVSSVTTGSMIITLADPNIDSPINKSQTSWIMVGNGLLSGAGNVNRVTDAIDQAFQQSPYLKVN
ncbi:DUF4136 domain-containing protein [Shivajiella indica]|uniref:DUF4136 domain-containing protein n=1 Tax=Shivajiella indica TaxID=872115 RepID=A0ABW5BEJ5_9BACT